MDKLSEHAIRMLEIEGKGKNDGYIETRNMGDIARAVYDLILQVQMLKEVNCKSNSSENPNNCEPKTETCEGCKYENGPFCTVDGDCKYYDRYEPKDENHSGEATEIVEPKEGEWKTEYHGNGWNDYWDYACSNCGKKYERADAVLYKANYCPNCGAEMKGTDDEVLRQL